MWDISCIASISFIVHVKIYETCIVVLITVYLSQISVVYTRYLLDAGWFKKWKTYVGFDDWIQINKGDSHPGPIDNSPLLKGSGKVYLHSHRFSYADDNISII